MKRNRFTTTRFVLVVILIGGLYKVGTLVNPPPPGPPEPPKAADAAAQQAAAAAKQAQPQMSQKEMAKQMADRMKTQQRQNEVYAEKQALERKLNHGQLLSKDDGITPVYFQETPMGKAGLSAVEKAAANNKRISDEVNKQMASKMAAVKAASANMSPTTMSMPMPSPTPGPPASAPGK